MNLPLEEQLLALGGQIADWKGEPNEETRKLKLEQCVQTLWDIAMNLDKDKWGYLSLSDGLRIVQVIGSP